MSTLRRIAGLSVILFSTAPWMVASSSLALAPGEQMTFRVAWGIFPSAGEIVVSATDGSASDEMLVTTTTGTRGFLKNFFPFEARSTALFQTSTGLLLNTEEISTSKKKQTRQELSFDYVSRRADYRNEVDPGKSTQLDVPPGQPMDLITALIQTRAWHLQPGEMQDALVIFDDDFYELTIYAEGYETLRTPMGEFKTLVLVPRMEKTEPKGMFKRGSTVKVWISQDERRLPVRFQVDFKFGAGVATLIHYQAPADAAVPQTGSIAQATHAADTRS